VSHKKVVEGREPAVWGATKLYVPEKLACAVRELLELPDGSGGSSSESERPRSRIDETNDLAVRATRLGT
jgi:hypothetical protein